MFLTLYNEIELVGKYFIEGKRNVSKVVFISTTFRYIKHKIPVSL